ncbi:putative DNA repair protein rad9 [Aspergillus ruber CBS 135680]|uniref:DNA repair protein rad9 n=1 Tax=Aspergillus ruber (strain CBS 135680) TaxID=1388766 RepID=A0A017SLA2_ASPRC|nr:putative DNA repair protein Rad9 [Aspergillus ruber CBS 135680]EYE97531.1 putative DNA repair protein Rad9 [Aspergillus ruber CBS 135680]
MTRLSFSITPASLIKLHEALTCLVKFNESVALEAEYDLLRLSVLNSTKTAYSAFVLEADDFFEKYSFSPNKDISSASSSNRRPDRFCCQIYLKALLSVFKGRTSEKDKDTAIERCEVEIREDAQQTECRLVIRMICGLGVIKSYRLTYEPIHVQHAIFDRSRTANKWTIEPKFLREIADHFSPSAEQLDIHPEGDKAIFTSFTTKIAEGKEILKQPVHTSVAIDKKDFEDFLVEESLHIAISIKDFKAAITHAETANALLTARYTRPCRPLQLSYEFEGVKAEFTLMTKGEAGGDDVPNSSRGTAHQSLARQSQPTAQVSANRSGSRAPENRRTDMPPPLPPAAARSRSRPIRPLTGTPSTSRKTNNKNTENERPAVASMEFDSLFVPADDDRQWDVPNDDDEEEAEDMLGWDATADQETFSASLGRLQDNESHTLRRDEPVELEQDDMGIPPTQRMSQLHGLGLFD